MQGIDELSSEEKRKLLDAACGMDRIILLLLFETELDIESLIGLHVSDLDQQTGELRIPPDRKVQLSSAAHSEIMQYLKSRPGQVHLLEGRCGKPVTCKWKRCVLESLLKRAGPGKH